MDSSTVNPTKTLSATTSAVSTISTEGEHRARNWANMEPDIIRKLVDYLDRKTDVPRLRSVCRSWRSVLPLSLISQLPIQFEFPNIFKNDGNNNPLYLVETKFYLLSSLHPDLGGGQWLVRTSDQGPNKWHLLNPLNISKDHQYFYSRPPIIGEFNFLDCQIQHLCSSWLLVKSGNDNKLDYKTKKIVGGWIFKSSRFAVLAQLDRVVGHGHGDGGELMLWRMGDNNISILQETVKPNWQTLDIAYLDGRFYAFDVFFWRMGVIDLDDYCSDEPKMKFFAGVPERNIINGRICLIIDGCNFLLESLSLVPSNDRLFMVIEASLFYKSGADNDEEINLGEKLEKKTVMFFFVLKEGQSIEKNSWERVPDIGDNIFYIGYDTSFSLPSASENLPQWKPGSICMFTWPVQMTYDYGKPEGLEQMTFAMYWNYFRIYKRKTEEEEKCIVPYVDIESLDKHEYTSLFFPPPAWVIWRCPSRDNAVVNLHDLKFHED